nr:MbtH family NRPS accessory protein [Streptacidiphilus pinicola]
MHEQTGPATHAVVVNEAEQYSVWPAGRRPPAGWRQVGAPGTREHCLGVISRSWTDMRPLSLREGRGDVASAGTGTGTEQAVRVEQGSAA